MISSRRPSIFPRRSLCLCLFFLCSIFGSAQDGRRVTCRFVCFEGVTPPPPLVNVLDKGAEVVCTIPANEFSKEFVCSAKGNLINFLSSEDHKPAASATIPANVRAAILVFIPAVKEASPLPWQIFVIEDSLKNFPDGGAFVANFYSKDIRFVIGENKIMLPSGKDHGFARPTQRDAFNMAPVVFEFQQDDTWRTASESLLRFVPGMRYLIFAYVDAASGRPRISTFEDFMPIAPSPPPATGPRPPR